MQVQVPDKLLKQHCKAAQAGLTACAGAGFVASRTVASRLLPSNSRLLLVWIGWLGTCKMNCNAKVMFATIKSNPFGSNALWQAPGRASLLLHPSFCSAGAVQAPQCHNVICC
jgi:hypothetical protein